MSMPSFPPNGADMTQEEALTMIIASIAMEELALSHILNAEGEKLQYILGTLPGTSPCACPHDVLAVNKSVTALVEAVTQNQMTVEKQAGSGARVLPASIAPAAQLVSRSRDLRPVLPLAGQIPVCPSVRCPAPHPIQCLIRYCPVKKALFN